tara:strand:+ start:156 stop:545 length:390 start_codon:yes stop_codon:yes gene_type:complete
MKKLLALLLLSPLVVSEDDFPIELTCEIGASIVYFNLERTEEGSWWTPHDSHQFKGKFQTSFFNNKTFRDKKNTNFRNYNITDGQISFHLKSANLSPTIHINRYTLGISSQNSFGQCYLGFKEYNEKQI